MKTKDYRKKTQSPLQFQGKLEREARYIERTLARGKNTKGEPLTGKREKQLKADLIRLRKKSPRLVYSSLTGRPARRTEYGYEPK